MNEHHNKQVEYVRLKRGTTRAHATSIVLSGAKLEPAWEKELEALYAKEAESLEALKAAERTPETKK